MRSSLLLLACLFLGDVEVLGHHECLEELLYYIGMWVVSYAKVELDFSEKKEALLNTVEGLPEVCGKLIICGGFAAGVGAGAEFMKYL